MIRVTLPSDGSHNFYPQNTLSNYTIKLPRPFDFDNIEHECALSEIIFPNRLVNVRQGFNSIDIYRFKEKDGNLKKHYKTWRIPPGSYDSIVSVVNIINGSILRRYTIKKENAFTLSYDEITKRVTIETRFNYAIRLGTDICILLGFEVGKLCLRGMDMIEGKRTGEFYASKSGGLNTLYVYTDIIEEQIVGGMYAPLLKVINLGQKKNNEDSSSFTPERQFYCEGKISHFDSVNIQLRDDTGELVHFEFGKVIIFLEFRPKV
jgi:hypothetical protein